MRLIAPKAKNLKHFSNWRLGICDDKYDRQQHIHTKCGLPFLDLLGIDDRFGPLLGRAAINGISGWHDLSKYLASNPRLLTDLCQLRRF